jgi:HD-GYP domain-containing protein (c-di-GMP phosphodiesterase class II)
MAELERCAGTQFDPVVVSAFQAVLSEPARASTHVQPSEISAAAADRSSAR